MGGVIVFTIGDDDLYNADYYLNYKPKPYINLDFWRAYFAEIAGHIVRTLDVKTVLDVGCALGILVDELRSRDIDARGIDISPWAIANSVAPDFCTVGSILDAPKQRYDMVICIEVVEHLPPEQAEQAIDTLCSYAPMVLFSSTPIDEEQDPTHLNVQMPVYWNAFFVKNGYRRNPMREPFHLLPWGQLWRKYP